MVAHAAADAPPCRTLYVRNLPEKLPKARLRTLLHAAAAPHGAVVWVAAAKTLPLRGQAFVTFESLAGAAAALRELNGAQFLGRTIVVAYARAESDRVAEDRAAVRKERAGKRREREAAVEGEKAGAGEGERDGEREGEGGVADVDMDVDGEEDGAGEGAAGGVGEPNRILFVEGLPAVATAAGAGLLDGLFGRFAGFGEVRTAPGRRDIAFVEFAAEGDAAVALAGLQGHRLEGGGVMRLSYAKK